MSINELLKDFREFFYRAMGHARDPYPYQEELAIAATFPELLDVPTGLGKTAAVVLAWLYHRRCHPDFSVRNSTPRRLVYCLPMRVLVEQTERATREWLVQAGMIDVGIHILMGGVDGGDWLHCPERDAILIGTQDMLLSRALNRGYGSRRAKWPIEFGLLNNDCLWVFDEVQLMGNGVATSAQLDGFRKAVWSPMRPCHSLWMSATLEEHILRTRDRDDLAIAVGSRLRLSPQDHQKDSVRERLNADKSVAVLNSEPSAKKRDGSGILDHHLPGRLSLVILNTVRDAQRVFQDIQRANGLQTPKKKKPTEKTPDKKSPRPDVLLLHSRFRPADRRKRIEKVDEFCRRQGDSNGAVADHPGLIVVSTQVVEAGYDLSAARLWSEIAPWSSVVQRLGRLNREGKQPDARGSFWMPKADSKGENAPDRPNAKRIGPYEKPALQTTEKLLDQLIKRQESGECYRAALDAVLGLEESRSALELIPEAVVRSHDFYGLFSTEPDLAGGYTDVSPFVRSIDRDVDVLVFWRIFDVTQGPGPDEPPPQGDELCAVPFYVFRKFLGKARCWEWDFENDWWQPQRAAGIFPGMTLMLACSQGGYSTEFGWTGDQSDKPDSVPFEDTDTGTRNHRQGVLDSMKRDPGSETVDWHPIADHLDDVVAELEEILNAMPEIGSSFVKALRTAADWHDWGKSISRWQSGVHRYAEQTLERIDQVLDDVRASHLHTVASDIKARFRRGLSEANGTLWAKFPDSRQIVSEMQLPCDQSEELLSRVRVAFRPKLRHEAASALAAWKAWRSGNVSLNALAVYLIASHHGKVRTVLRSLGDSDQVFGLTFDDQLQPVSPRFTESMPLSFEPKIVGHTGSWSDDGTSFTPTDPCWTTMISDLLGPPPGYPESCVALSDTEPAALGLFKMALLEAILRAADARASRDPGKGAKL